MALRLCQERMPVLVSKLLASEPRQVVLSGPSGFLGSRVLDMIMQTHTLRREAGLDPGEVVLLSSSPGRLMGRLSEQYEDMRTVRASRVDYYSQHKPRTWRDHLGSLGVNGNSCFVNLAAVAGPIRGRRDAMFSVNYSAAVAAALACEDLGVSHFVQASTQATNSERAGQVPYSRGKAMADHNLSQIKGMPVTIACVGLLYAQAPAAHGSSGLASASVGVGQDLGPKKLNLIDLSVLPLTPIMGSGRAPLQPQTVSDAALRLGILALTDPAQRPHQVVRSSSRLQRLQQWQSSASASTSASAPVTAAAAAAAAPPPSSLRIYDAVGPSTMSMVDMLQRFAYIKGNRHFRPVHVDYRNIERVLNIMSLGNLNRQFVSLLRSEQDDLKAEPFVGDSRAWDRLAGPDEAVRLTSLDSLVADAMASRGETESIVPSPSGAMEDEAAAAAASALAAASASASASASAPSRRWLPRLPPVLDFPFWTLAKLVARNPKVLLPGLQLTAEVVQGALAQGLFSWRNGTTTVEQELLFLRKFGDDPSVHADDVRALRERFDSFDLGKEGEVDEHQAMLMLEDSMGSSSTDAACEEDSQAHFQNLREMIDNVADQDGNGRLSFIEYACLHFGKRMEEWELNVVPRSISGSNRGTFLRQRQQQDSKSAGQDDASEAEMPMFVRMQLPSKGQEVESEEEAKKKSQLQQVQAVEVSARMKTGNKNSYAMAVAAAAKAASTKAAEAATATTVTAATSGTTPTPIPTVREPKRRPVRQRQVQLAPQQQQHAGNKPRYARQLWTLTDDEVDGPGPSSFDAARGGDESDVDVNENVEGGAGGADEEGWGPWG